ncbi:hypothetical protein Dsin_017139 [Dipteronia sinensis]|uniref:Uncharacterized protein n=1 Tax=Dipteronia sinensis TaxID=43782 RepID=A0AAE0AF79_9ROSI|nr:hypothetical protein Dsin_017139 [Dipteronia sinensis]
MLAKGLMFMSATIRGKLVRTMLDIGAMHNFIFVDEAKRLSLRITNEECAIIKAANSPAKQVDGTAKGVTVHLSPWSGKLDFSMIPIDDYQVVLGMAFFEQGNTFPLPAAYSPFRWNPCLSHARCYPPYGSRRH